MKITIITGVLSVLMYTVASAQMKSSFGLGAGVNQPLAAGFKIGWGAIAQGSIRLNDKLGLVPAIGYERLNAETNHTYTINNAIYITRKADILYGGLTLKYYISNCISVKPGAMGYIVTGSDDIVAGVSPSFALAYEPTINNKKNIEISLRADAIKLRTNPGDTRGIVGLRLAYNFALRR
ncbi:hypothetical protein DYU05_03650 [Mucilaginibacter terrenus]|uniref:Outer membrane protein beta-barrel domain-containing protein n=1 Tax=Mucilaginibacter terrenus TaxID=2482727 RepID=A0A3E2NUM3_9SPHI|nr:hypothetical protein [Mucilaginibacter terrenus]RFZ84714.1 hypothetical protein DYU05_03650 [Mucilaginibacter terrenus]